MRFLAAVLLACLSGCASLQGGLIPASKNSGVVDNELLCMEPMVTVDEAAAAAFLIAPVVRQLAGFLIDQTADAVDREAKHYKATYSARAADELFVYRTRRDAKGALQAVKQQRLTGFRFARFAGGSALADCAAARKSKASAAMSFEAAFDISDGGSLKIRPTSFTYDKARAKVAPWASGLDVNVQVSVSVATLSGDGVKGSAEIGRADFPMGKMRLGADIRRDEVRLSHLVAGWYPLPDFALPGIAGSTFGPISVMVTVIEADELGDVLAKGAKSLRGKKAKLVEKLLKELESEE